MRMAPESGEVRPAMQSSSVVLPAPDDPKTMVNRAGAEKSTSSVNSASPACVLRKCAFSAGVYATGSAEESALAAVPAGWGLLAMSFGCRIVILHFSGFGNQGFSCQEGREG